MGLYNSAGTRLTTGTLAKTAYTPADAVFTLTNDTYTDRVMAGEEANFRNPGGQTPTGRVLWKKAGARVTQSQIDAVFGTATLTSITPGTGPAAGGTAVTFHGTNLTGASGVNIGAVACTSVVIVSPTTITAVTGAHAAGAVAAAVIDDSGTANLASPAFTYT